MTICRPITDHSATEFPVQLKIKPSTHVFIKFAWQHKLQLVFVIHMNNSDNPTFFANNLIFLASSHWFTYLHVISELNYMLGLFARNTSTECNAIRTPSSKLPITFLFMPDILHALSNIINIYDF